MTIYERGDIVLVPFPFSNQAITKKRPAVIISSNDYNKISPDVIIMAITGREEQTFDIVESVIDDWQNAGLLKPSTMKPAISTIEKDLVLRRLGSLSPRDLSSLDKALKKLVSL